MTEEEEGEDKGEAEQGFRILLLLQSDQTQTKGHCNQRLMIIVAMAMKNEMELRLVKKVAAR